MILQLVQLPGLITPEVGITLYHLASEVPRDQTIVELGSYHGKSTAFLTAGSQAGHKAQVYAIDAWSDKVNAWSKYHEPPNLKQFRKALASVGLSEYVIAVRGKTVEVAKRYIDPRKIGLLYVDADHSERAAWSDVMAWYRHLAPGAIVAFDDYAETVNPGVKVAVERLCNAGHLDWVELAQGRLAICRVPTP